MTASIVVASLLIDSLLAGATSILEILLRDRGIATRWIWLVAIVATLLLPFASAVIPATIAPASVHTVDATSLLIGKQRGSADPEARPSEGSLELPARPGRSAGASSASPLEDASSSLRALGSGGDLIATSPGLSSVLTLLWGLLSLCVLGTTGAASAQLGARISQLPTLRARGREVHVARRIGPAVVGVIRPRIVLPEWLLAAPAGVLEIALLHEEEHLKARDTRLLAAGAIAAALVPWKPFLWYQLHRLRVAVELDCDRRVISAGIPSTRYASVLLEVGEIQSALPVGALALATPPSEVERRLRALFSPIRSVGSIRAGTMVAAAILLVAIAAGVGAATEVTEVTAHPTPAPVPTSDLPVQPTGEIRSIPLEAIPPDSAGRDEFETPEAVFAPPATPGARSEIASQMPLAFPEPMPLRRLAGIEAIAAEVHLDSLAAAGEVIARRECLVCHTRDAFARTGLLDHIGSDPTDLYRYLSTLKPTDDPGSLTEDEYAAVSAYLLQLQGLPHSGDR